jgi:Na+/H+-dicarboxylate symporter
LHTRIFIGFGAGTAAGLLVNYISPPSPGSWSMWAVVNLAEPAGKIFLRLLLMTVVPVVVTSLTLGVAGLGDERRLGRVGLKTLALTLVVSSISVGTGLFLANAARPGYRVPSEVREQLFRANKMKASEAVAGAKAGERSAAQALVEMVPDNPFASAAKTPPDMLALMLFSVVLGIALALSNVLTVGATANQNGTALYEGVTVLFLAQLFGVDLTLSQQLMLLVLRPMRACAAESCPGAPWPSAARAELSPPFTSPAGALDLASPAGVSGSLRP